MKMAEEDPNCKKLRKILRRNMFSFCFLPPILEQTLGIEVQHTPLASIDERTIVACENEICSQSTTHHLSEVLT